MRFTTSLLLASTITSAAFGQEIYLNQGWNDDEREEFYFTPQGSQLIPYRWFLALEQPTSDDLFRSEANMKRYGILPAKPSPRNPDGLPIGFVRDGVDKSESGNAAAAAKRQVQRRSLRFDIKQSYLGKESTEKLYPREQEAWFGLTCAACHTHEIDYGGKTVRIDGGSTQADLESFLRDLGLALEATHTQPEKLGRFATAIGRSSANRQSLGDEVKQIADAVNRLVERNKVAHPYGFGRLDAFGAILNAVCETALDDPRNRRPANAPVSYPSLWNTPHMSQVQWAATADRPEKRNVGEVLGVFGWFSLEPGPKLFDSTVRLGNLLCLEHGLLGHLTAPDWPEDVLGELDQAKVRRGEKLFRQNCQSCHPVRGADGEFALNDAKRIQVISNTLEEVGTDAQFLNNLSPADHVFTGILKDELNGTEKVPRLLVLATVVRGIMAKRASAEGIDLTETDPGPQPPPHPRGMGSGYISRPLEGIWANPPYFHNGSVPSLYETLLPAAERRLSFSVGARNFDPVNVGFAIDAEGAGKFEVNDDDGTPIIGNSNVGHEGHGSSPAEGFTQTFEDGEWRDFTDDERYALVEYMKSLSSRPRTPGDSESLEAVPDGEAEMIASLVDLMSARMQKQYSGAKRMLRGVHPKDHGCVTATFEVLPDLPPDYRVGVFQPGETYDAFIRFSNAATQVGPDSNRDPSGRAGHGSRGMAVKLLGVEGKSLLPLHGALTQDFLMVNQPAFAFATVHDYELFNQTEGDGLPKFLAWKAAMEASENPGAAQRALRTLQIVGRVTASAVVGDKGAFEQPPASPVDNTYHGAAVFQFGDGRVMKYRARPVNRSMEAPNVDDPNYLRTALIKRLASESVEFEFAVQVRTADQLDIATDVENASTEWDDPFVPVARIIIGPQQFDSPEQRVKCERLFFTPWHGITDHRPLGGINRARKAVYLKSVELRSLPKEPSGL